MKKLIIYFAAALFFYACNPKSDKKTSDSSAKADTLSYALDFDFMDSSQAIKYNNFAKKILDDFLSGKIKAYNDYNFKNIITPEEFKKNTTMIDSVVYKSKINPKKDSSSVIITVINPKDISEIVFHEKTYFDENILSFKKEIIGYSLARKCYTSDPKTGEKIFKGSAILFSVKNDK